MGSNRSVNDHARIMRGSCATNEVGCHPLRLAQQDRQVGRVRGAVAVEVEVV